MSFLTDKQYRLLEKAVEKGGIDQEMGLEVYANQSNVSENLQHLVEIGLLEKDKAPPRSDKVYVWFPTDKTKALIGDNTGNMGDIEQSSGNNPPYMRKSESG